MNSQNKKKSKTWSSKEEAALVELWEKKTHLMKEEHSRNDVYSEIAYLMRQWRSDMRVVDVKNKLYNLIKKYKQYKQDLVSGAYPASWPLYERIHRILKSSNNAASILQDIDYDSNMEGSLDASSSSCQSPTASNSTIDNNFQDDENSLLSSTFNALKSSSNIKKRRRRGPQMSWNMEEEKELIMYLKEHKDSFEKPIAQRFYTEFLQTSSFYREWKTVCNKVRNMRMKYEKAKGFLKSRDPSVMHKGETIRGTMYRLCYYFDDFREIFDRDDIGDDFVIPLDDTTDETSADFYSKDTSNIKRSTSNRIWYEENSSESSPMLKGQKRRRLSKGLHKIWSQEEEKEVILFLKENKQFFEKPTAIRFYESFLKSSNLDVEPDVLRSKVRNMRTKYEKAKAFLKSPDKKVMRALESIQDTANRLCYFYEDFKETFSESNLRHNIRYAELMNETNTENENEETPASSISLDNSGSPNMSTQEIKEVCSEDGNSSESPPIVEKSDVRIKKSWSFDEEREIIIFLKENKHYFEKPTIKEFYSKLLKSSRINADQNAIREKVRYMRTKYEKACLFLKCPDPTFMKEGETDLDVAKRFCYFYEDFKDIFGEENLKLHSPKCTNGEEENYMRNKQDIDGSSYSLRVKKMFSQVSEDDPLSGLFLEANYDPLAAKHQPQNQQYEDDNREMLYLQVREKEIESNERIKKMELEMKERVAMREIEMKEKLALKELEICEKYMIATGEQGEMDLEKLTGPFGDV